MKSLSRVRLLATPWTAAYQAPPSIGFSKQEYWSGVPLPSPILPSTDQHSLWIEFLGQTFLFVFFFVHLEFSECLNLVGFSEAFPERRGVEKYRLSVQFSLSVVSDSLQPPELQHARPPRSEERRVGKECYS